MTKLIRSILKIVMAGSFLFVAVIKSLSIFMATVCNVRRLGWNFFQMDSFAARSSIGFTLDGLQKFRIGLAMQSFVNVRLSWVRVGENLDGNCHLLRVLVTRKNNIAARGGTSPFLQPEPSSSFEG